MEFVGRSPQAPELDGIVDQFWYCADEHISGTETVLPIGRAQLVIGLHHSAELAALQGPTDRPRVIDASVQRRAVGVSFTSVGATAIFRESAERFEGELIDLDHIWSRTDLLIDALGSSSEPHETLLRLERHLVQRLLRPTTATVSFASSSATGMRRPLDPRSHRDTSGGCFVEPRVVAAERLLRQGCPVGEVASTLGVDRRRLGGEFRQSVGYGLKYFSRISRFEHTIAVLRQPDAPGLATIAAELGYADQAHLTREFKAFSGLTPSTLHRRSGPAPNHVTDEIFKTSSTEAATMAP